ncbi:low molecular weight protein-tyrosine-phosphatase [Pseudomonas nitroreducens]|uniref:low molecular weight protein-tyrosine-phosphatase n=1 Tax=Pseudomonas nitroreducens TaxID=46680 RepID=UPI00265B0133|nr:low molecular weight protein-tyrosine-phosphatase [Pseudomonas nitroreducens]MCP1647236.1 protein-tyrosine phosphatase [Pseudomonas nitroreducens]MCP1685812.1 protein-tyrosine phosphatase [Pseudomonas nitroreducens]
MFNQVLIVCVGNICRSPTAEHLLRQALQGCHIQVGSAGLAALVDKPLEQNALATLTQHGQQPAAHRARQLTPKILQESDLVLVMERNHLRDLLQQSPQSRGKTFLLGKWQNDREIPDPYRQGQAAFEHAYALIDEAVATWSKYLRTTR